jgi:hypothetical protein
MAGEHPHSKYQELRGRTLVRTVESFINDADALFLLERQADTSLASYRYENGIATHTLEAFAVDETEGDRWYMDGDTFLIEQRQALPVTTEYALIIEQRTNALHSTLASLAIHEFLGTSAVPFVKEYTLELHAGGSATALVEQNAILKASGLDAAAMTAYDFDRLEEYIALLKNIRTAAPSQHDSVSERGI